jgi:hypothetical protein
MDLSKAVSYNNFEINTVVAGAGGAPTSGFRVESFQPIPPDAVGHVEKRALQDGLDASDVYLAGRLFRLIVTPYGTSKGDFWDKAQELMSTFNARVAYESNTAIKGFLHFDFYQPTADISTWPTSTYPSGIPMRYYMRTVSSPEYVIERDRDGGDGARGHSKPFTITLLARDPRKYLQETQEVSITSSTQTVTYRGDYPTFPIITFSLTNTGNSAFTLQVNGRSLVMDTTSLSTGTIEIDFARRTLIGQASGDSKYALVTSTAEGFFSEIDVGSTYRRDNGTGISSSTMTFREAFA